MTQGHDEHWLNPETRNRLVTLARNKIPDSKKYWHANIESLTDDQLCEIATEGVNPQKFLERPELFDKVTQVFPDITTMYPHVDFKTLSVKTLKSLARGESPLDLLGEPVLPSYKTMLDQQRTQYQLDHQYRKRGPGIYRGGNIRSCVIPQGRGDPVASSDITYSGRNQG